MKKAYTKPQIFLDNFSLCTSIAAGCEIKGNDVTPTYNEYGCGYIYGRSGDMVFVTETMGCGFEEPDEDHDGICYHTPSDANNIFNS